jgi:hypothetical protein
MVVYNLVREACLAAEYLRAQGREGEEVMDSEPPPSGWWSWVSRLMGKG